MSAITLASKVTLTGSQSEAIAEASTRIRLKLARSRWVSRSNNKHQPSNQIARPMLYRVRCREEVSAFIGESLAAQPLVTHKGWARLKIYSI
jgi:hypothetical protein